MKILISIIGNYIPDSVKILIPWNREAESENNDICHQIALQRAIKPDLTWLLGTKDAKASNSSLIPHDDFIEIPKGMEDSEFWEMFTNINDALLSKLPNISSSYDIFLDITNGLRVQPMFLVTVVRSVCQLLPSKFSLNSAYYNAYEKGNPTSTLLKVDPILDLEYLAQDLNLLLSYSVAEPLAKRLESLKKIRENSIITKLHSALIDRKEAEKNALLGQAMRDDSAIKILRNLILTLRRFGAVVGINHTPSAAETVKKLCEYSVEAGKVFTDELKPAGQALLKLREELFKLLPQNSNPLWGWHAALAKWCMDRGLDQQALTHAEEMITTRACEESGLDPLDKDNRIKCGTPLKAMGRDGSCLTPDEIKPLIGAWNAITLRRNGVNHAFTGDPNEQNAEMIRSAVKCEVERLLIANNTLSSWPKMLLCD